MRRHHSIRFAGGAIVFPGGKLDRSDYDRRMGAHLCGTRNLSTSERAHRLACIRELFEETGMVFARRDGADVINETQRARLARLYRTRSEKGLAGFNQIVARARLMLPIERLQLFSHWITPPEMYRRFDTRFYLARAPRGQRPRADGTEAVNLDWLRPQEIIRLADAGEITLLFPTRLNLMKLSESRTVAGALANNRRHRAIPIMPEVREIDGRKRLTIPRAAGYGITVAEPNMLPKIERDGIFGRHMVDSA